MKSHTITSRNSGFTLVELLVSIAIFGVVLAAIGGLLNINSKLYFSKENTMIMTQDLRAAMNLMVREIRMAGCDPTGAGGIGFLNDTDDRYNTDGNSIHFTIDTTDTAGTGSPDGLVDGPNEDINYYLYTTNGIQKIGRRTGGAGSPSPVAEYITALSFAYYDSSGAVLSPPLSTADLDNIYAVDISITAQTPECDPITHTKKSNSLTTRVKVRNAGLQ